jgi:TctA family transporter
MDAAGSILGGVAGVIPEAGGDVAGWLAGELARLGIDGDGSPPRHT